MPDLQDTGIKPGESLAEWTARVGSQQQPVPQSPPIESSGIQEGETLTDWSARRARASDPALNYAVTQGLTKDPERSARLLTAQYQTGYSLPFIDRNLDNVESEVKRTAFSIERIRAGSPLTAKFLRENPERVGLFAPDLRGLTAAEQFLMEASNPDIRLRAWTPAERVEQAKRRAEQKFKEYANSPMVWLGWGTINQEQMKKDYEERALDEINAQEEAIAKTEQIGFRESMGNKFALDNPVPFAPLIGNISDLEKAGELYRAKERLRAGGDDLADQELLIREWRYRLAAARRGESVGGNLADLMVTLPQFIGSIGMTKAVGAGVKGAVTMGTETLAAQRLGSLMGLATQVGFAAPVDIVKDIYQRMAPEGQPEADKNGNFTYKIKTNTGEELSVAVPKALLNSLMDYGTANIQLNPLFKAFASKTPGATPQSFLRTIYKEGVSGALSFIGLNEATKMAKDVLEVGPAYELPTSESAIAQGIVGAVLHVANPVMERMAAFSDNEKARGVAETLSKVAEIVKEMEADKKAPEIVEQALNSFVAGTNRAFVPLDPYKFEGHYQEKGIEPHAFAAELTGREDALKDALDLGHPLQIPTGAYISKIGKTDSGAFFQGEHRFDPMAPGSAEAQKHLEEVDAKMEEERKAKKEAAKAKKDTTQEAAPNADQLAAGLAQQAEQNFGSSKEEAGFFGKLVASGLKMFGIRARQSAKEMEKYVPTLEKGETPTPDSFQQPAPPDTEEFKSWFAGSQVTNEAGKPIVVFHGSQRPDRVGSRFRKSRATSGPMAFFTSDPDIGSKYATGKRDTSLEQPDSYDKWFTFKPKGSRSPVSIDRAWYYLSPKEQEKIAALAPRVTQTDEGKTILGPEGESRGLGGYDQHIKEARGNHLKALVEEWLSSGALFNDEDKFLKVLDLAGFKGAKLEDPNATYPSVFPVFLNIKKPLDTSAIPPQVIDALEQRANKIRKKPESYGADLWDKRTRDAKEWIATLKEDYAKGVNSHAWSSIPDWVTETLKEFGYDGIKDLGGKMGGVEHNVWVPFEETQIKSATGNRGTFDPSNPNILFQGANVAPPFYHKIQKTIEEKMPVSAPVAQVRGLIKDLKPEEIKWSGIEDFLKDKEKVSKEELLTFLRLNQLEINEVKKGEPGAPAKISWEEIPDVENEREGRKAYEFKTDNRDGDVILLVERQNSWLVSGPLRNQRANSFDEARTIGESMVRQLEAAAKPANPAQYEQYTLPGGENYRELLLTLPKQRGQELTELQGDMRAIQLQDGSWWVSNHDGDDLTKGTFRTKELAIAAALKNINAGEFSKYDDLGPTFKAPHFREPNILAHIRFDDRVDSDGKKTLFIEEVQSDWHQQGRKKGYKDPELRARIEALDRERQKLETDALKYTDAGKDASGEIIGRWTQVKEEIERLTNKADKSVPEAPFKKTWHEFALKRMIRYAAENGYERLAWTTGQQQAERYDLSKQVEGVRAEKLTEHGGVAYWELEYRRSAGGSWQSFSGDGVPSEKLEDYIGKELAKKIVDGQGQHHAMTVKQSTIDKYPWNVVDQDGAVYNSYTTREAADAEAEDLNGREGDAQYFHGLDLKVGGEGMKGFYDEILPAFAAKFGKKFDAKVEATRVSQGDDIAPSVKENRSIEQEFDEALLNAGLPLAELEDISRFWGSGGREKAMRIAPEATKKYERAYRLSKMAQAHSLVISPELRKAAVEEGFSLFQPGTADNPRGEYVPRDITGNKPIIRAYQSSDPSTLVHEPGHLFLDILAELSQRPEADQFESGHDVTLKQDFQTFLDWRGIKDAETWQKMTLAEKKPHHEAWADAYEQWLFEGKAPSNALRQVFYRFRQWLGQVYDKFKGKGIEIPDQIRAVFERIHASDAEIQAAKERMGRLEPFIEDIPSMVFTQAEHEKMAALQAEGNLHAVERMDTEALSDIKEQQSEQYQHAKETIRKAVTQEVDQRKDIRALAILQKGTMPDGSALPENLQGFKLDRKAVEAKYGKQTARLLPHGVLGPEGLDADLAAEVLGFDSGGELVRALKALQESRFQNEPELRAKLAALDEHRSSLEQAREQLKPENEAAREQLEKGRIPLVKQLEESLRSEERAKVQDLQDLLDEIQARGGIRPTERTESLPSRLKAKVGTGIGSDELAQEFYDRGIIKDAYSDDLYDYLQKAVKAVSDAKERAKDAKAEAERLAKEKFGQSIEDLISNVKQSEAITELLAKTRKERGDVIRGTPDPRTAAIEGETESRAAQNLVDPTTTLPEDARAAIHGDAEQRLKVYQMEWLAKNKLPERDDLIRKFTDPVRYIRELRGFAETKVEKLTIENLDPRIWERGEKDARKAAREAILKSDIQTAIAFKERETLNHEIFRAATEAKEEFKDSQVFVKKLFQPDADLAKSRDMDLVNAGRAILAEFGLGKSEKSAADWLKPISLYDADVYETIKSLVDSAIAGAKPYEKATIGQLREMKVAVEALWELAKRSREMMIQGRLVAKELGVEAVSTRLKAVDQSYARQGFDKKVSDWEKTKIGLMGLRGAVRRVESWGDAVDGNDPTKPVFTYITRPVFEATANYREAKKQNRAGYMEDVKLLDQSKLTEAEIPAPELNYTFKDKGEVIAAILHSGNVGPGSNLEKNLLGRGWAKRDAEGVVDTSRWEAFRARMIQEGVLTKDVYDYAQAVWDRFEAMKVEAQKAHKNMYGFYFKEITANPIETPWGTYRGGYVPAIVDPLMVKDAAQRAEKQALEKNDNSFMFPTTGRDFTKSRSAGYTQPLMMDLGMLPVQFDKVLRFIHIEQAIKDVGRVVFDKSFRNALDAFDPAVAGDMLVPWLQRTAQQRTSEPTKGWAGRAMDTACRYLRARTGMQMMVANIANAMQQATGISSAALKVEPANLRSALWEYTRRPGEVAKEIDEKSVYMRNRSSLKMMELQSSIDDILLNPSTWEKAQDIANKHGYFFQEGVQNVVDRITWMGAYGEGVAKGMNEADAVAHADSVVRQTQFSNAPEDISRFEAGTPFIRMFTMFTSHYNMRANLLATEFTKSMRDFGLRKGAGRALYIYTMGFMIPAVIGAAIEQAWSGHLTRAAMNAENQTDDDSYMWEFMKFFFGSQARSAGAMVPIVGPIVTSTVSNFSGKGTDNLNTSPAISAIEHAVASPHSVYKAMTGDGRPSTAIRDTATALGILTGLPFGALARPVGYLADMAHGDEQPTGPIDFTRGLISGHGVPKK